MLPGAGKQLTGGEQEKPSPMGRSPRDGSLGGFLHRPGRQLVLAAGRDGHWKNSGSTRPFLCSCVVLFCVRARPRIPLKTEKGKAKRLQGDVVNTPDINPGLLRTHPVHE